MTEQNIPFITEHRDVYRCPWCGKPYLRKQDVMYHINMKCRKNPTHVHPCFWCDQLEKVDHETVFFWNRPWGEEEEVRTIPSFYCKKHGQWMYSVLAGKHHHPCSADEEHVQMPMECKDFSMGVPTKWDPEKFNEIPWYKKHNKNWKSEQ